MMCKLVYFYLQNETSVFVNRYIICQSMSRINNIIVLVLSVRQNETNFFFDSSARRIHSYFAYRDITDDRDVQSYTSYIEKFY